MSKIIVWVPLRPGASWTGEGIAETLNNVINNFSERLLVEVVCSSHHYFELSHIFKDKRNVTIRKLGFSKSSKKKEFSSNFYQNTGIISKFIFDKFFSRYIKGFENLFNNFIYLIGLNFFYFKENALIKPNDVYWIPVPVIPGVEKLKGKRVWSFWDPFVFEYREFSNYADFVYKKFRANFRNDDFIITQSTNNANYLEKILKIDADRIAVIPVGSPDYSKLVLDENVDLDNIIDKWGRSNFIAENYEAFLKAKFLEDYNKTILWRLSRKKNKNTKVILISTQDRVYKGLKLLLNILDRIVSEESKYGLSINFIFTSEVKGKEKYPRIFERIHEVTRVSSYQHALLYSIADLAIHPSFVEGGRGAYPQFEAQSLGKPSLINGGRHVLESSNSYHIDLDANSCDFANIPLVCEKIFALLTDNQLIEKNIKNVSQMRVSWLEASSVYEKLFESMKNEK